MMFDPNTGKVKNPDDLRSINMGAGRKPSQKIVDGKKQTEMIGEHGGTAGYHVEHSSGRIDAVVTQ